MFGLANLCAGANRTPIMLPTPFGVDVSWYVPGTRHTPHAHEELQISLVLKGSLVESVGGRVEQAGALSVAVKDPQVTHEDQFGREGALLVRLCVRGRGIADLVEHPDRAYPWRWTHDAAVARPFLRIVGRSTRGPVKLTSTDDDITDLLAALSARSAAPASGEPPAWVRDVVARIRDGWSPGLTVHDLAHAAGVHPVYLARCIRRWYGMSVGDLLRQERLRHAARGVAADESTVSSVAHGLRFSDEAHLCREFSRAVGLTPGRYRRLSRSLG